MPINMNRLKTKMDGVLNDFLSQTEDRVLCTSIVSIETKSAHYDPYTKTSGTPETITFYAIRDSKETFRVSESFRGYVLNIGESTLIAKYAEKANILKIKDNGGIITISPDNDGQKYIIRAINYDPLLVTCSVIVKAVD